MLIPPDYHVVKSLTAVLGSNATSMIEAYLDNPILIAISISSYYHL
jgi:hypothetical protein